MASSDKPVQEADPIDVSPPVLSSEADFIVDEPAEVTDKSTGFARPSGLTAESDPSSYTLQFKYACRKNIQSDSCQAKVFWNGEQIVHIIPADHAIHTKTHHVTVVAGENTLKMEGAGKEDTYGLTIDDVKLTKDGTTDNIVINGGFEEPDQKGKWNVYDEIEGWKGKGIEIGRGTIYNSAWESQICELDGHEHGYLSQVWTFDDSLTLTQ